MLIVIGLLWAAPSEAATLHFITFADTLEEYIGTPDDYENSQTWAQTIASATGLTLDYQSLTEYDLTVGNAWKLLDGITCDADDVIYFYYTGHGGNPGDAKWPTLYFSLTPWEAGNDLTVDEIRETLEARSPRLLVLLADCCNNYPWQSGRALPKYAPRALSSHAKANFRRLFVDYSGSMISSGSEPGQFSLGGPGSGGLFTNCFMNALETLAESESVLTWDAVMVKTRNDTAAEAAWSGETQEPQYELTAGWTPEDPSQDDPVDDGGDDPGGGVLPNDPADGGDPADNPYADDPPPSYWESDPTGTGTECGAAGPGILMMTLAGLTLMSRPCRGDRS